MIGDWFKKHTYMHKWGLGSAGIIRLCSNNESGFRKRTRLQMEDLVRKANVFFFRLQILISLRQPCEIQPSLFLARKCQPLLTFYETSDCDCYNLLVSGTPSPITAHLPLNLSSWLWHFIISGGAHLHPSLTAMVLTSLTYSLSTFKHSQLKDCNCQPKDGYTG